jgi:hypothetical protein
MSKIEKLQNIFKQTLEFATTLWIQKGGASRKGGGEPRRGCNKKHVVCSYCCVKLIIKVKYKS